MNPCGFNDALSPFARFSGQPVPSQSDHRLSRDLTKVVQTPDMLTQPVRELLKVTPAQEQRAQLMRRVHCRRGPQYDIEYQIALNWLKTVWPQYEGKTTETRLISLLMRPDVPKIMCQSLLHETLKEIDPNHPPILHDIKRAYIAIGVGTTPKLNAWVKQTWFSSEQKTLKQRISLLIENAPDATLANVSTLHAILWNLLGKKAPSLGLMKRVSQQLWAEYWLDPRLISWIEQHWKIVNPKSQQANVAALLRQPGMPQGTSVSMITAGLARVLRAKPPGFDTVSRAVTQVRKEKQWSQPPQNADEALASPLMLPAPRCAAASHTQSSPINPQTFVPAGGEDLTVQQYRDRLDDSDLWASVTAAFPPAMTAAECAEERAPEEYHDWMNDSNLWARVAEVLERPMFEAEFSGYAAAQQYPPATDHHAHIEWFPQREQSAAEPVQQGNTAAFR